jgi:hypothetical protein
LEVETYTLPGREALNLGYHERYKMKTPISTTDPKAAMAQLKAEMKKLRDAQKAAREAAKGSVVADRIATADKYIAIFRNRKSRLLSKCAKLDELILQLTDRNTKDKALLKK